MYRAAVSKIILIIDEGVHFPIKSSSFDLCSYHVSDFSQRVSSDSLAHKYFAMVTLCTSKTLTVHSSKLS